MPGRTRSVVVIAIAAALTVPAAAEAALTFVRNPLKPVVWVARDDGSGQKQVAPGSIPRVSPDGETIAYMRIAGGRSYRPDLVIAPADGSAPPRRLVAGFREPFTFAWSPDSSMIAAVRGPELGRKRLVLIDVASGAQRTVAGGFFSGASFAPESGREGGQLVYSRAAKETFPPRSDVYRLDLLPPGVESVALGALTNRLTHDHGSPSQALTEYGLVAERPHRLTRDHRSLSPLWSPARPPVCVRAPCLPPTTAGQIVFVKLLGAERRRYGPKNELYLMGADGGNVRRLTHTRVDPLLMGLIPTEWSADGTRLLAELVGQDTSYAVTVNPRTGAQRPAAKAVEDGLIGFALSADGSTILGATGGWEPGPGHNVVAVPYGGGRAKLLVRNAFEPDWNR